MQLSRAVPDFLATDNNYGEGASGTENNFTYHFGLNMCYFNCTLRFTLSYNLMYVTIPTQRLETAKGQAFYLFILFLRVGFLNPLSSETNK